MCELSWQKSSYSEDGGNNCVEVATAPDGIAVRDSKVPDETFAVRPAAFRALIAGLCAEHLTAPSA